jgi:TRAP-type uncharacterized transport system fused permease subunit
MGREATLPRRLEHRRHDIHGLDFRLARRRRSAADRDLHHRRGRHRAADAGARHQPWIAHFFVFLMSVWGELSPPTSLTAAVSARIANASFLKTMYEALKICAPITLMTFAIFTRPNMVVNPGWMQVADTMLVLISTCGVTFAMFGRFHQKRRVDFLLRSLMALVSFVVMFHPDTKVSAAVAIPVAAAIAFGIWRHRIIAPPKTAAETEGMAASAEELAPLLAEAKREVG